MADRIYELAKYERLGFDQIKIERLQETVQLIRELDPRRNELIARLGGLAERIQACRQDQE